MTAPFLPDPRNEPDSVVGIRTECLIVDLYATDGQCLAIPTDPYIMDRARAQCKKYAEYNYKKKLSEEL